MLQNADVTFNALNDVVLALVGRWRWRGKTRRRREPDAPWSPPTSRFCGKWVLEIAGERKERIIGGTGGATTGAASSSSTIAALSSAEVAAAAAR